MKADKATLDLLNRVLKNSLTQINQYFLHARMMRNWGLDRLNAAEYRASIAVMKESDEIIQRILMLEGLPNLQSLGRLMIGEEPVECLRGDLSMELELHRPLLLEGIAQLEAARDYVSRELLEELLESCEERIDVLETRFTLLESLGRERFLQLQVGGEG